MSRDSFRDQRITPFIGAKRENPPSRADKIAELANLGMNAPKDANGLRTDCGKASRSAKPGPATGNARPHRTVLFQKKPPRRKGLKSATNA